MEKLKNKSFILYASAIFLILVDILMTSFIEMSELVTIFLLLIACLLIYIGGYFYSKETGNKKILKFNLYLFFLMYLALLFYFLFLNHWWHRSGIDVEMNLTPFSTIKMYIKDFDSIMESKPILNLLGNFICLMPLSFFLKYLFKKQNNTFIFLITLLLCSFGIETMQYLTKTGSFDIDDIMLNTSGAILMYLILKFKSVDLLIRNILFFEKNKISKISLIIIVCFVTLVLILFIAINQYRNILFNKRMDEYEAMMRPSITFEYKDECSNNNLFYEDEVYKYYFTCYDKDNFYAVVNGKDKLLIKELLDDSEYNTNINEILNHMDYDHIEYKIEYKYAHFNFKIENKNYKNMTVPGIVDSDIAKLIIRNNGEDYTNYEVSIIPKKSGAETINIDFEISNDSGVVIDKITKKVKVTVDENLNVTYDIIE